MRVLVAPLLRRYVLTAPSPCCCTHQPSIDNRAPKKYQHLVVRAKKVQKEEERYQEIERENAILLSKMDKIASWSSERAARPSSYRSSLGAGWGGAKPGVLRQVRRQGPEQAPNARSAHAPCSSASRTSKRALLSHRMLTTFMTTVQGLDNTYVAPAKVSAAGSNERVRRNEMRRITTENLALLQRIEARRPVYSVAMWDEDWRQTQEYQKNLVPRKFRKQADASGRPVRPVSAPRERPRRVVPQGLGDARYARDRQRPSSAVPRVAYDSRQDRMAMTRPAFEL